MRPALVVLRAADYLARCGRRFDAGLQPLMPTRRGKNANDASVRAAEAAALLKASEGCTRIALDKSGQQPSSSEAFAASVESLLARGKPLAFLIGGATGLHESLLQGAGSGGDVFALWSLSKVTFAHRLAVCVLAEQLYRASEIARGGPYHKS